jgi:hypothetical protein
MKPTTLYNHIQLGTTEKPLIPNAHYKQMMDELRKGNTVPYLLYTKAFTLESNQKRMSEQLFNHITDKNKP